MAELVKSAIALNTVSAAVTYTAASASDYIDITGYPDWRIGIVAVNADTHAATLTLKAGNGDRASAGDVVISVPASTTVYAPMSRIETSRVKCVNGVNKGKILTVAATVGGTLSLNVAVVAEK